jgi:hypothetical protein
MTTGRLVPRDLLITALEQVPKSVEKLSPLVDYTAELHNAPHADDIQLVAPKGETWDSFKEQWSQTCAWEPKRIAQTKLGAGKPLTKTPSSERLAAAQLIGALPGVKLVSGSQSTWPNKQKRGGGGKQPLTVTIRTPSLSEQLTGAGSGNSNNSSDDGDRTATAATTTSAVATLSVSSS